ncbi:MAG: hypothetical protein GY805_32780, partial [Chloroflexi bacterium]|nr:hypothetical protein [Chloroflexota bacterium]
SDIAAKLIHFGFGLLLGGLVYVVTRRLFGTKAAWPAVVILVSMPMLGTLAGWAYNDLALAFYQFAGLYAVSNWLLVKSNWGETDDEEQWVKETTKREPIQNPKPVLSEVHIEPSRDVEGSKIQNRPWLVLCGLFAGLAMGLKYTSFVTPVIVVLLILWFGFRQKQLKQATINVALFSLVALLVAFPWYVKNWVFTGNPVYPFLSGMFDGQYWDSFRAEWYASAGTGIGWQPVDFYGFVSNLFCEGIVCASTEEYYGGNLSLTLLTLPLLLVLGFSDINYWDGRTGPLLLLFLPVVVWAAFSRRFADRPAAYNLTLVYVLAHFIFWTLGVIWSRSLWQSRLLLPGLVGLVPVAGWIWANLSRFDLPQFSLSRFVNIAVTITLILIVVDVGLLTLQINPLPYILGLETRRDHLTRRLGAHYATMEQINQELPAQAKIAFLWEPRSYYCNRDCRPDSILDEFPHLVYQYGS